MRIPRRAKARIKTVSMSHCHVMECKCGQLPSEVVLRGEYRVQTLSCRSIYSFQYPGLLALVQPCEHMCICTRSLQSCPQLLQPPTHVWQAHMLLSAAAALSQSNCCQR